MLLVTNTSGPAPPYPVIPSDAVFSVVLLEIMTPDDVSIKLIADAKVL